jgi:hypothetical protein
VHMSGATGAKVNAFRAPEAFQARVTVVGSKILYLEDGLITKSLVLKTGKLRMGPKPVWRRFISNHQVWIIISIVGLALLGLVAASLAGLRLSSGFGLALLVVSTLAAASLILTAIAILARSLEAPAWDTYATVDSARIRFDFGSIVLSLPSVQFGGLAREDQLEALTRVRLPVQGLGTKPGSKALPISVSYHSVAPGGTTVGPVRY